MGIEFFHLNKKSSTLLREKIEVQAPKSSMSAIMKMKSPKQLSISYMCLLFFILNFSIYKLYFFSRKYGKTQRRTGHISVIQQLGFQYNLNKNVKIQTMSKCNQSRFLTLINGCKRPLFYSIQQFMALLLLKLK